MIDKITEHIVDGVRVKVFKLPSGAYCALIVSDEAVFQATFNAELKTTSIVSDHPKVVELTKLPPAPPTPEMLTVMKAAVLRHMHAQEKLD
jgi:hypothetical protein